MHPRGSLLPEHTAGIALVAALGAVGCAPGDVDALYPVPRPLGQDIPAFRAGRDPAQPAAGSPAVEEPTGTITLRQALVLALARNPELAAASWEVRAAEAKALQAGLTPNPEVRVRMGDFGGTGDFEGTKDSEQSIRLSQVIELGGKAATRRRAARSEAALCGWDYEAERLDVFAETTKAFVAALAAQDRLAAAQDMHELAERVMSLVSKRVKGGAGSDLEANEARIALGTSRIDLARARQALEAARGVLASFWDAEKPTFQRAAGKLGDLALGEVPALEHLLERVLDNPDVARWETEAHMRQAALESEKADSVPDLRVLLGTKRVEDTGDHGYSVALEMSLPVFDRNQGSIREGRFKRIKAAYQRRAALMAAAAALRQANQTLSASHQEAILLRDVVVPAAQDALDVTRRALERGAVTDLQLLKAQRTLFKARTQQIAALEAYHMAAADVERLTAHPLGAVAAPKQPRTPQRRRVE
jgi:cobalt-zinc-cadmium efflux system outer membrane protein